MPRNVEDIIPKKSRSIRDVPMPEERRTRTRRSTDRAQEVIIPLHKERELPEEVVREAREEAEEAPIPRMKVGFGGSSRVRSRGRWSKPSTWIASGIGIAVLLFVIFSLMRNATLAYTPKSSALNFQNESFSAFKTGGEGSLLFGVVKISDTKGVPVQATGEMQVSRKATGTIVVYNDASTQPQTLVRNTRFEAADGHVYRVQKDITIPGKSGSTPGALEVSVTADQPGAEYNQGLTDFTIPGLKGDSRFETMYARSKTPMSGGYVGMEKTVSAEALAKARTELDTNLKASLIEQARAQVPADFILFPSLSQITYAEMPQSSSTGSTVNVNERGDFYGVIFKKSDLAEYLKLKKLATAGDQPIDITDLNTLAFNFAGNPPQDLLSANQISFTINGSATAVWLIDEASLKRDLAGISKDDIAGILKSYPGILSADATIRPFWKSTFPTDATQITVKKNPLK